MTPPTNRFYPRTPNDPPHPVGTPIGRPPTQFLLRTPNDSPHPITTKSPCTAKTAQGHLLYEKSREYKESHTKKNCEDADDPTYHQSTFRRLCVLVPPTQFQIQGGVRCGRIKNTGQDQESPNESAHKKSLSVYIT